MKDYCPICEEHKKLEWLGYVHQDICKNCHTDIDMDIVKDTLPMIIKEAIKSQKKYVKNYVYCIGDILEKLISDNKITATQYLSCANFLVANKIIYECYLSFKQFAFTIEIMEFDKKQIVERLKSLLNFEVAQHSTNTYCFAVVELAAQLLKQGSKMSRI